MTEHSPLACAFREWSAVTTGAVVGGAAASLLYFVRSAGDTNLFHLMIAVMGFGVPVGAAVGIAIVDRFVAPRPKRSLPAVVASMPCCVLGVVVGRLASDVLPQWAWPFYVLIVAACGYGGYRGTATVHELLRRRT